MQKSTTYVAVILPVLIITLDSIRRFIQINRERKKLPLPPGPAQIPLLGNAHSVDVDAPWKTYADWHAKYGDIIYIRLLDEEIIILGSRPVAVELFEKRSHLYSDRPFMATVVPFGADHILGFIPYGDHWRTCRRIFHQTFRPDAALTFCPMQLRRARQLVINIVEDPAGYVSHYSNFASAVALSATYDYDTKPRHDPMAALIDEYTAVLGRAFSPEKSVLLKLFPFFLHIPDWLPGSSLKRQANCSYSLSRKVIEMPFQHAVEKMKASREGPTFSMISDHLSRIEGKDEAYRTQYITALKKAAVTAIIGAEDTTSSALGVFTLAMVLHPHILKRAQAEIDAVVGTNRLPNFSDRPALPYVEAILRETLRWYPVAPIGVPHATLDSDVYNGYYIPKGATVIANAWAMTRDEARFPNPETFLPERYLNEDGTLNKNDPSDIVFGFGRRICPGRSTADVSIWTAIVTLLATLDFCPAKDANGKDIRIEPKWLNGLTSRPDVFPCQISPRAHVDKSRLEHMLN